MNIEAELVAAYNTSDVIQYLGYEASTDVPELRDLFSAEAPSGQIITVERVGGGRVDVRDRPLVAVQVWSPTRWQASEVAMTVAEVTRSLAYTNARIARVDIESIYNNPDPDSGHPRYQITAQIVTT